MWTPLRTWRRRRRLARSDTSEQAWRRAWQGLPLLHGLSPDEARRLRELATLFLHEKSLEPAQGLVLRPWMGQEMALQACLPILNLGLDWYAGWYSVILYPDTFVSNFEHHDEAGVVHEIREARSGEAWERGPLVLSWADADEGRFHDGFNVVIHEAAHKLDALDGGSNGRPPLHSDMNPDAWSRDLGAAYADLQRRLEAGRDTPIDDYAAESPAEFFAVVSEAFFETPDVLQQAYPAVYDQLRRFYRQDPALRLGGDVAQPYASGPEPLFFDRTR
jgi:Mlc titration factor MtfA (ptsG expression regulator)